jgi:hypothetical protein
MDYATENSKDFTPCGKPAEESIKQWFTQN